MAHPGTTAPRSLTDLLFEEAGVGLCLVAPDGTVVRVNAEWLRSTGFTAAQVIGEDILDLFPGVRDMALALHERARAGHRVEVPRHAHSVNGRETWWEGTVAPVPMDGGTGLLITAHEVKPRGGEQPRANAGSAAASEVLDTLLACVPEGITIATGPEVVTVVNSRYADELLLGRWEHDAGFTVEEWLARVAHYLPDGKTRARVEDLPLWRAARFGESVQDAELILERPDGSRLSVACNAEPIRDAAGKLVGGIVAWRDVTDRKQQQAALRASEERFRLLADAMPQIVCVLAPDGTVEYVNGTWTAYAGLDTAGTARAGWERVIHPEDASAARACRSLALKRLQPQDVELRYRAVDGTYRWFLSRLAPVVEAGRVVRFIGAAMDIDARKSAEEALRASTALLAAISDTSDDVIFAKDREGRLQFANPATLALVGKPLRSVLGHTDGEILEDAEAARLVMENDRRIMASGTQEELEERVPLPDGTERIWLSRKSPYRDAEGRVVGLLGISRDITERKRTELALRASEERLRLALTAAHMVAWEYAPATKQVMMSENAAELLALRCGRLHEDSDQGFSLIHPEDVEHHRALVADAIENARGYVSVYRQIGDDGEVRWIEERGRAVTDASGRTVRLVGVSQNITDRKRAEEALRAANQRLVEADRRKDEFLGMLSHELRNPLAPIRNSSYILRHASAGSEQARRAQEVIERQTGHLTHLVDDLLDVTRIARGKVELRRARVDVRDVVARAAEDFRVMLHDRGVAFDVTIPDQKLWADADATRLTQVVGNLLHNASKFTRRGDTVTLSMSATDGAAEIRVRDTGAGIEPALLPRVFDAFVQGERTLARTEGGLGLGLALVKGIIELHGGTVRADSAGKGRGSEFVVRLPLLPAGGAGASPEPRAQRTTGSRRVLVVDDNVDAAESLADIVRLLGHSVEIAHDGASALAKARANPPGTVLCDIGLPEMSGYEVAQALRRMAPEGIQLIAVSGYAQPEDVQRAVEAGFDAHVAKPCDPEKIERLLG